MTDCQSSETDDSVSDDPSPYSRNNFVTFLTAAQYYDIDFVPLSWESALEGAAPGGTARLNVSSLDAQTHFVFKRTRIRNGLGQSRHDGWDDAPTFDALVAEITVLRHPLLQHHQNIVNLEGIGWEVVTGGKPVWPVLILEKAEHRDLYSFMNSAQGSILSFEDKLDLCADVTSALNALHDCNGMHGDIKPQNIFIFKDGQQGVFAKIADLGYSFLAEKGDDEMMVFPAKSVPWHAPEYHHRGMTMKKARLMDVYSFGILCLWLLFPEHVLDRAYKSLTSVRSRSNDQSSKDLDRTRNRYLQKAKLDGELRVLALEIVLKSLDPNGQQSANLREFFNLTLAHDPDERTLNIEMLAGLLTQNWLPGPSTMDELPLSLPPALACFNVSQAFFQFMRGNHCVRQYMTTCLEKYALSLQTPRARAQKLAFQLALCYRLGFGVAANELQVSFWLSKSTRTLNDVKVEVDMLKSTFDPYSFRSGRLLSLMSKRVLHGNWAGGDGEAQNLTLNIEEHRREIADMKKALGEINSIVFSLQSTLIVMLRKQGRYKESEAILIEQLGKTMSLPAPSDGPRSRLQLRAKLGKWDLSKTHSNSLKLRAPSANAKPNILQKLASSVRDVHEDAVSALKQLASVYLDQALWDQAEWILFYVRQRDVEMFEDDNRDSFDTVISLAHVYVRQGHWEDAHRLLSYVENLQSRYLGDSHRQTLVTMINLARLYEDRDWRHQEQKLKKRIQELSKIWFEEKNEPGYEYLQTQLEFQPNEAGGPLSAGSQDYFDPLVTLELEYLVKDHLRNAEFSEAEKAQQRLLMICRKRYPDPDNRFTLLAMHNMAALWGKQGRWEEAETLMSEVVDRRSKALGDLHEDSLASTANFAEICRALGLHTKSQALFENVVRSYQVVKGENHPDTLLRKVSLAATYDSQGQKLRAARMLDETLEKQKEILGPEHHDTMASMRLRASWFLHEGKMQEAEEPYQRYLNHQKTLYGLQHPDIVGSSNGLAAVYSSQSRWKEVIDLLTPVCDIATPVLGEDHALIQTMLMLLGSAYLAQRQLDQAGRLFSTAWKKRIELLGAQHWSTRESLGRLGTCFWKQGQRKEALRCWYRAWRWKGSQSYDWVCYVPNLFYQVGCAVLERWRSLSVFWKSHEA